MAVNVYETVFIAEPEISNDQVDQLVNKLKGVISTSQGTVTGEDRWGRRRLAYAIQAHREGFYVVLNFTAEPPVVKGLEHLFNVTDSVIRHMTTRIIKKNKKFAPRRERPAGATDVHRPGGRPTGSRPPPRFTPPPAATASPAATTEAPAPAPVAEAPAAAATPVTAPETGSNA